MLRNKHKFSILIVLGLLLVGGLAVRGTTVRAADNNFSVGGITVDSTLDAPDDTVGDGNCDDGAGNCTLRAAIEEANYTSGANTINFNIPGGGVKTIQPTSALPDITDEVTINGYSQPGSQANSAISPQPFNGTLLIEIDGSNAGDVSGFILNTDASNTTISGLVINRFERGGIYLGATSPSNITIAGNYIGTSTTGLVAQGNEGAGGTGAIQLDSTTMTNIVIGGSTAAARNIISGNSNTGMGGVAMSTSNGGTISIRGNYIGVGADGTTDLGNYQGVVLRGSADVIDNVISGNTAENIFHGGSQAVISGNRIGTDYTGNVNGSITQSGGVTISQSASEIVIGGTGNGDGNIIAGNARAGVQIISIYLPFPVTLTPEKIAILGNSIFDNTPVSFAGGSLPGLGIDLFHVVLDGSFQPVSVDEEGVTSNDASDADTGANNYMNFPVLSTAVQTGTNLKVTFDLDAADSPSDEYRVEFFSSDTPHSTGHGDGKTYLGSTTVANGTGLVADLTLPSSASMAGKSITATTTAVDGTTDSGFGATSELAANIVPTVTSSAGDQQLAATGQSTVAVAALGLLSIFAASSILIKRRSL